MSCAVAAAVRPRGGRLLLVPLGLALVVVAVTTEGFLSADNARVVLASVAVTGLLALGATLIMISGNFFSLSFGVTLVASSMVFLASLKFGLVVAMALAIALGALAGVVQGILVGAFGANAIVVTLAFASIGQGVAIWLTDGAAVRPSTASDAYRWLVDSDILGVPMEAVVFLVGAVVLHAVLTATTFGRELYLVGTNKEAARGAGVRVGRVTAIAFVIAGACAGIAGILAGASSSQATLGFTSTYDFDAVTAVLVGGVSIAGGQGSVSRTVLGAFALAILSDVLVLRGAELQTQVLVKGLLVMAAVGFAGWHHLRAKGA
jgi:ribose/xylose/arabinose/galactoside ABC-type transport system permease subunit